MKNLKKACGFCIYQERTQHEVREKLKSWFVPAEESEEIISWLITENFLNEGRYAKQFVGGKFRVKKWGRRKILYALKSKGLSENNIREALKEIDPNDYWETLVSLAEKKRNSALKPESLAMVKKKVSSYLLAKGYEMDLIVEAMREWK
jgi:regulatory protein